MFSYSLLLLCLFVRTHSMSLNVIKFYYALLVFIPSKLKLYTLRIIERYNLFFSLSILLYCIVLFVELKIEQINNEFGRKNNYALINIIGVVG